jgi:hypothetical protein
MQNHASTGVASAGKVLYGIYYRFNELALNTFRENLVLER